MIKIKIDVCIPTKEEKIFSLPKLDKLEINKIIVSTRKGLSEARNELMQKATTEWFLFLDDDITINQKWWDKISSYTNDEKIGAICGFGLSDSIILNVIRHLLLVVRGTKSQRGFTSNTLIRKKAVKGIILTREGRLEDKELQDKIIANGYEWKFCYAYCKHNKKAWKILKEALSDFNILRREVGLIKALKII